MTKLAICILIAGCAADDGIDESIGDPTLEFAPRRGIDYAWGRPGGQFLRDHGFTFAARYLSFDNSGKNLGGGEAHDLLAHGLDVVVVWENGAMDVLDGFARGASDAHNALAQANAAGMPAGRPIYFAIDFDAQPFQQGPIDSYFDGAASVLGRDRVGAYGGFHQVGRLFDHGKIAWGWQTYAWSAGQWDSRAQLRQTLNGVSTNGVDSDIDYAQKPDFGQWNAPRKGNDVVIADVGKVVAARNANGSAEVFWVDASAQIHHAWQTAANGAWSDPAALGGKAKQLAAIPNAGGRLELLYIGTDDKLYHRWQTTPGGSWSAEAGFGIAATALSVGRNEDGRLEAIYAGADAKLHHMWQTKANGTWNDGAPMAGAATAVRLAINEDGRLEVAYLGTGGKLYHQWQTAPNSSWSHEAALGGSGESLAIAANADGRLELVYADANAQLRHQWQTAPNASWNPGADMAGAAKDIALARNSDGRLEAIYVGTDGKLYHQWQTTPNGSWSHEAALDHSGTDLAIGHDADGRLELFYLTPTGSLGHMWQAHGGGWTSGAQLGAMMAY